MNLLSRYSVRDGSEWHLTVNVAETDDLVQIETKNGLNRDLNPGPLAPKARIIPLDH